MRAWALAIWLPCAGALAGCASSDVGEPCAQLLGDASPSTPGDGRTETSEVVAYDPTFPCESLICVASAGRAGYCSRGCREDVSCPSAFECRVIQPVGAFAGQKFCAWKACNRTSDCGGSKKQYCCRPVPGSDPVTLKKYCDFARGDTCE